MAIRRRARRLWDYWRSERRTLRQGFVALLASTAAAFVAGLVLGSITGTLQALPGLIVLIPASVGLRGTIFGAIGARLGTSIQVGLFDASLRRGGVLSQNILVGLLMTLGSSLYLAALARVVSAAFGLPSISFWQLVTISVVGGLLASVLILGVTIVIAVASYRRGWDLDTVATPMITAVGDMITLPALFLATFLVRNPTLNALLAAACVAAAIAAIVRGVLIKDRATKRILLEMAGAALIAPLLDIFAGAVAETRLPEFIALPALLMLVPPFVSQAGALGGILSSRLSSKLRLGVITPRGLPEGPAVLDASLVMGFGVVVFAVIGAVGIALASMFGLAHPGVGPMLGGTLLGGILATVIAIVAGYYLAVVTSRFGLDPDNHGVPLITSFMDLSGIVCLLFAMSVFGVS